MRPSSRQILWTQRILLLVSLLISLPATVLCQQSSSEQFPGLKWRLIGPFRGGRVTAVAGVPGDPRTYYFGTPGGGIWKTTSGGRVWTPIFDQIRVPSIGALAVAPSNPNVIYAGTGEQTRGKGMYRSSDGGATWTSAGLEDNPYIQAVLVDSRNPDIVVVGTNAGGFQILWRPLPKSVASRSRGIFRTEDGGKTWKKVYASDANLGVVDMCADPDNPSTLYSAVYVPESSNPKPTAETNSNKKPEETPPTSEIIKSTDGGVTWAPLQTKGLPEKGRGRLGISVAAKTGGRRLYAIMEQGFYRSDDGGANWYQSTKDPRILGNAYFSRIFGDPQNADTLYVSQTSMYRSTDGGKTFEAFTGAPSGDDFHVAWIDPQNSARMIFGVDQGAIISVDAGKTWTSWYNQPTGQFYHVSTDNVFPYRVYGAQQDSGTAGVLSRSDYGEILLQDWYSIGGFEYAFIAPDPAHPNFIFSNGWYGSVVRYDSLTGEIATMFERGQKYRAAGMPPLVFSPQDPSVIYLGMQMVLKSSDGARSWEQISPDLTDYVEKPDDDKEDSAAIAFPAQTILASARSQQGGSKPAQMRPASLPQSAQLLQTSLDLRNSYEPEPELDAFFGKGGEEEEGALDAPPPSITALAPSPVDASMMWAGTSNRIVQLTRDGGKTWTKVTPPGLEEPTEILYVEPSHHDAATAYLTIGGTRESSPPFVLRTHDYGHTWQKIVNGFPADEMVRVVREDPKQHCVQSTIKPRTCSPLLYAGTDTGVYFSWDDGDRWQPLSLNLPPTPVTDIAVHDNDLAISTFGRSFWILDDVSALREFSPAIANAKMHLFEPADAVRVRWMNYQDTPYPAETPAGQNPPDGAIFDYYLTSAATSELTLTIYDEKNNEIAAFTSEPKPADLPPANVPEYWFAPPATLTGTSGINRFAWNLRYPAPKTLPYGYYGKLLEYTEYTLADHAVPGLTPRVQPRGPLVAPGQYTVELRYAGQGTRWPFTVTADPRIHASPADLVEQRDVALSITRGMASTYDIFHQVEALRQAMTNAQKALIGADADKVKPAADALSKKLDAVEKGKRTAPGFGPVNRDLARLIFSVESADIRPTETVRSAVQQNCDALDKDLSQWQQINQQDVPAFNALLNGTKASALPIAPATISGCKQSH
jgi:photosystem II stability/assembly factor-like uncharacterized protein